MADSAQKRTYKTLPAWRKAIAVHRLFLTDVFPDESSYGDSRWDSWEERIHAGPRWLLFRSHSVLSCRTTIAAGCHAGLCWATPPSHNSNRQ